MAATFIQTKSGNLVFKTEKRMLKGEPVYIASYYVSDDKLNALSDVERCELLVPEERWHRELRADAAKRNQLITTLSTNPNWNPKGYKKGLDV
jgi:hypothetical protein